ncbi:hypothetical protein MYX82_03195 [Acidobacteria bacterium AH-259-D05]|nr:hypothetical protein [Acidobacteria bacterium AH-259-D05]
MKLVTLSIAVFLLQPQNVDNDPKFLDLLEAEDLRIKDLFDHPIDGLKSTLGEPAQFVDSNGQMYGHAIWEFQDYEIEVSFHPVTDPIINFLSFTSTNPDATMDLVLSELSLNEFNGQPAPLREGVWRWRSYIAQETLFERVTWYEEDHSIAIKK